MPDSTPAKIGERLREARSALPSDADPTEKRTQTEFAKALEIEQTLLSRWERGASAIPADRLPEIATRLGVSIEWLLTGRGDPPPNRVAGASPSPERAA